MACFNFVLFLFQGVPERNGEGGFNTIEELVMVLSAVIYTCSAGHAAANFKQYSEYGYVPNYPTMLHGEVIKDKVNIIISIN